MYICFSWREAIYTFTPATTGSYAIQQISSTITNIQYAFKTVTSGCSATGWTCIQDLNGASTSATFSLTAGTQYYIILDPRTSTAGGTVVFNIVCPPTPPANDDCTGAIPLTVGTSCSYTSGSNVGATATTSPSTPPAPGCANYSGGDVWYSVVVPSSGTIIIDTQSGGITDSGIALYTGTCGALTLVSCNDDGSSNGGFMSGLTANGLTVGSTVYIRVWEYGNDTFGTFGICVTTPYDPCTSIINIPTCGSNNSVTFASGTGTINNGNSGACFSAPGKEYIYSFTPTTTGNYAIQQTASSSWTEYFYKTAGSCIGGWTCIKEIYGAGTSGTITLTAGVQYYFLVDAYSTTGQTASFYITCPPSACNGNGTGTSSLACPSAIAGGLGLSGAAAPPITCTTGTCVNLEATYLPLGDTSNYTATSIPYNPPYQFNCLRNPVSVNTDDVWSPVVNLPFTFCFYGNTYTTCIIGSNGIIRFGADGNAGGAAGWGIQTNLSGAYSASGGLTRGNALFNNSIYGVYHDLDPSKGGEVGWELITLNSGCRALVAAWRDVPMFSNNALLYTGMMVFYENTNVIEVYIKDKRIDGTWNDGNAIVGVRGASALQQLSLQIEMV